MSRKRTKRFLSILLTLCMVLVAIPATTMPVFAGDAGTVAEVSENHDLKVALNNPNITKIKLTDDIYLRYSYDDYHRNYVISWTNDDTKNRKNGMSYNSLFENTTDPKFYVVRGKKEVDLNGHNISLENGTRYNYASRSALGRDFYVFEIEYGNSLHIYDDSGGSKGKVYHNGSLDETAIGPLHFGGANLFKVQRGGELAIDSGIYQAGRSSKTWCVSVHDKNVGNLPMAYKYYNGWAYNMLGGAVVYNVGGKVSINGGEFSAYGSYSGNSQSRGVIVNQKSGDTGAQTVINGGTFKGVNKDVIRSLNPDNTVDIKGGTFTTQKLKMRYASQQSYSLTWYVDDVQPYLGMDSSSFNELSEFKYDGNKRDYAWTQGVNFKKSSKKLEVLPGSPKIKLYDGENPGDLKILRYATKDASGRDWYDCVVAKNADYKVKAYIEPYFEDLGLGRVSEPEYTVVNSKNGITYPNPGIFLVGNEFKVHTDTTGLTTYAFMATEELPGSEFALADFAYFDAIVVNAPKPVVTIEANDNPVSEGEEVTLRAEVNTDKWYITKYEWENLTTGDTFVAEADSGGFVTKGWIFNAPDTEGEYLIRCTVTDSYEGTGTDIFRLQVGGMGTAPIIPTNELVFQYNVDYQTKYVENIGGPVNNDDWELIGGGSSLPPGLSFIKSAGLAGFTGKPTQAGVFPVTIKATSGNKTTQKTINIIVSAPMVITTENLPDGVKGEAYEGATLAASGGGDIKWTIESGILPDGLDLNINTGAITGTPNPEYGSKYSFIVKATVSGQTPATKELELYVHAKPEFNAGPFVVPQGTISYKKLLKGGTGQITYSMGEDAPIGVEVTDESHFYGAGYLGVDASVAKGTYTFGVTANGYGTPVTETITLKVEEAPQLTGKYIIELPYGTVGEAYSSGDAISSAIYSSNPASWSMTAEDSANLAALGLTFNTSTGAITGTPSTSTGQHDSGYPVGVGLTFKLSSGELSETVYAHLYVVDPDDNMPTSRISFDETNQVNTATMYAGMLNQVFIYIDGVPKPVVEIENLPDWMNFSMGSNGNGTLHATLPTQIGEFSFTVKARNDKNATDEWITQTLTVKVESAPKAGIPTANPPSGMYTIGNLSSGITLSAPDYVADKIVWIYYSVNGEDFKTENTSTVTITDINSDTLIRAYTDTLFGLGGLHESNSDIVTFEYTLLGNDEAPVLVSITTDQLPGGTVDTDYTETTLEGSVSPDSELTWTVSGLPNGLNLTGGNKITGKPAANTAGDYNVMLIATAANAIPVKKTLTLSINEKVLDPADDPTIDTNPAGGTYKVNELASAMTVSASTNDGGTISYLWYESTDNKNDTPGNDTLVGHGDSYTPSTDLPGNRYYYAVAVNSVDGKADARTSSSVATIKVTFDAATPYFDAGDREYTFTKGTTQTIMDMASIDDEGVLTYKWYKKGSGDPDPSNDTEVTSEESAKGILEINTPATGGDEETYYAVATNSNDNANGNKTATSEPSPLHIVTATDKVMFEITFDPQTGNEDDKFTISTNFDGKLDQLPELERSGYTLVGWFTEESGGTQITLDSYKAVVSEDENAEIEYVLDVPGTVFTENTTVYAQWTKKSSGGGGTTIDPEKPVTPDPGDGGQQAELPFIDVKKADWFYDNVYYAYFNKLMMGTSTTTFSPHGDTTRGMIVTILHRLEGSPKASLDGLFADVNPELYYAEPIAWAAANNIVSGYSDDKFGPEDPITREQMAVILMNYAKFKGYDVTASADLSKFSDGGSVSSWAAEAMAWANAETLIQGSGEKLMPLGNAERAQVAAILHRFILKNTK